MNLEGIDLTVLIPDVVKMGKVNFPKETCGLILKGKEGVVVRHCKNLIEDLTLATNNFQLDPMEIIQAEKEGHEILFIFHTHCLTPPVPSVADRYGCKASGYPWLIVNPTTETYTITDPKATLPQSEVLGREFVWGMWDCYGLVRDIYHQELSIDLPDLDRGIFGAWNTSPHWNTFEENFQVAGFTKIPFSHSKGLAGMDLHKYDIILFSILNDSGNANHCGVLMDLDYMHFYHHLSGKLSEKSVYGSSWLQHTTGILRHHLLA